MPGEAWEHYRRALEESRLLTFELPLESSVDRARLEGYLEKHGSAIEHLRQGVRRSVVRPPGCPPPESASLAMHWLVFGPLSRLMVHQSRMLRSAGDSRSAIELLLDLSLFACDLSRNAYGNAEAGASEIRKWALNELRTYVVDRSLATDCLAILDQELRILEESAPDRAIILSNNTALLGGVLLANRDSWIDQPGISLGDMPALDWRHAFSKSLLALDLFTHADLWNRRAGAAVPLAWSEARRVHREIQEEGNASNDLLAFQALGAYAWSGLMRANLAKTRLLRVAVRYRRTGELLTLADPFGDRLQRAGPQNGRLQAWSVGEDAIGELDGGPWSPGTEAGKNFLWIQVDR